MRFTEATGKIDCNTCAAYGIWDEEKRVDSMAVSPERIDKALLPHFITAEIRKGIKGDVQKEEMEEGSSEGSITPKMRMFMTMRAEGPPSTQLHREAT